MAFVVGETAHEADEALFFEGLDCKQAVTGAYVLVQSQNERFSLWNDAIACDGHASSTVAESVSYGTQVSTRGSDHIKD
jgi:hypothetical protein